MAVESKSSSQNAMASSASRPLQLRMRADVTANRQSYQGRDYWVIKDPVSLKYYRFEEEEYALLKMLDGTSSPDQIKRRFDFEFAPQTISMQELYQFVGMLYRSCLLVSDGPNQGVELKRRGDKTAKQQFRSSLTNILSIQFKGFDPDRMLGWMNRKVGWFFSLPCFVLVLILGASAGMLLFTQFEVFQAKLPSFQDFFAARNWIWLALVMGLTKVCHEMGHGLACKRFGSECHEMGVMLLVLTPCLYCNVSDSWTLPSKWKRAFIAAAGMYVELVLASIATFVWWYSQPGLVNQLALNVIFVSSVSTILFNANPLLRYDGYYILSDLLEIPNLRQKASTVLQRTAGAWMLGIESRHDPFLPARRKWAFVLYSVAAAAYRWFITFAIFWFVYGLLEPYGFKLIGQAIAMMAIYGLIGMPLVKLYRFFSVPGRFGTVKPARAFISLAILMVALIGILMLPVPRYVYCSCFVQPVNAQPVYVDIPGQLVAVETKANQFVRRDQPIVKLASFDLNEQLLDMQTQVTIADLRLKTIRRAAQFDIGDGQQLMSQLAPAKAELESAQKQLVQRQQDIPRLLVKAPIDGFLLAPTRIVETKSDVGKLGEWDGTPLDTRNLGAYLDQKTMVGQIVPDVEKFEAVLAVSQEEIEFLQSQQTVELSIRQLPCRLMTSTTDQISPTKMQDVPKRMSSKYGGDLVTTTNRDGIEVPQSTHYLVSVPIDNTDDLLINGSTGVAKVRTGSQTIGGRIWRLAQKTFRFDL